jgi:hypothetical protein
LSSNTEINLGDVVNINGDLVVATTIIKSLTPHYSVAVEYSTETNSYHSKLLNFLRSQITSSSNAPVVWFSQNMHLSGQAFTRSMANQTEVNQTEATRMNANNTRTVDAIFRLPSNVIVTACKVHVRRTPPIQQIAQNVIVPNINNQMISVHGFQAQDARQVSFSGSPVTPTFTETQTFFTNTSNFANHMHLTPPVDHTLRLTIPARHTGMSMSNQAVTFNGIFVMVNDVRLHNTPQGASQSANIDVNILPSNIRVGSQDNTVRIGVRYPYASASVPQVHSEQITGVVYIEGYYRG